MRNEWAKRRLKITWLRRHKVPQKFMVADWDGKFRLVQDIATKMQAEGFYSYRSNLNDITRGLPNLIERAGNPKRPV